MSSGSHHSDDGKETKQDEGKESGVEQGGFKFVPRSGSLSPGKVPKGPARYRDPANPFNTWVGHGKRPDWLREYLDNGHDLSEFEVPDEE